MTRTDRIWIVMAYGLVGGFLGSQVTQLSGCKGTPYTSQADRSVDNADRSIAKIPARTETSDKFTKDIEKKVPKKFNSDILPSTIGIRAQNAAIREDVEDGQFALNTARVDIDTLGKKLAATTKDRDEWKDKANNFGRRVSILGMFIGLFGLAGGVVAFVYGRVWGKAVAIGSIVLVSGSIAIGMFSFWIGLGGLIAGVILVCIYLIRNLHVKDKADVEQVKSHEVVKEVLGQEAPHLRARLYGDDTPIPEDVTPLVAKVQSASTKALVKKIRPDVPRATPLIPAQKSVRTASTPHVTRTVAATVESTEVEKS